MSPSQQTAESLTVDLAVISWTATDTMGEPMRPPRRMSVCILYAAAARRRRTGSVVTAYSRFVALPKGSTLTIPVQAGVRLGFRRAG